MIGSPKDYQKNKEANSFPDINLTIPVDETDQAKNKLVSAG